MKIKLTKLKRFKWVAENDDFAKQKVTGEGRTKAEAIGSLIFNLSVYIVDGDSFDIEEPAKTGKCPECGSLYACPH